MSYPNLRSNLSPNVAAMPDHRLEALLERHGMDAEAMEGWLDDLGKIAANVGKTVLKAAPSVLPVAGKVIGTVVGGPVGASLGGALGSVASGALGTVAGQTPSAPSASSSSGSPAAGQMLQTIFKPEMMQALASMALGPLGKPNVQVGGCPVPVTAFANLLKVFGEQMESEYNAALAASTTGVPKYMQDYAGEPKGDPAVAQHRAEALYELLESSGSESASEQESSEIAGAVEYEQAENESEALQLECDAIEAAEIQELREAYESEEARAI